MKRTAPDGGQTKHGNVHVEGGGGHRHFRLGLPDMMATNVDKEAMTAGNQLDFSDYNKHPIGLIFLLGTFQWNEPGGHADDCRVLIHFISDMSVT